MYRVSLIAISFTNRTCYNENMLKSIFTIIEIVLLLLVATFITFLMLPIVIPLMIYYFLIALKPYVQPQQNLIQPTKPKIQIEIIEAHNAV